jgi:hypothetical protein
MRPLCLILIAASAFAGDIDINASGFWSKSYAIPHTYCERRIAVAAPRLEKLIEASSPCKFLTQDGVARSDCRLSREESDRVVAGLRHLGTLTGYSQNCDPPPDYPELNYKRVNLRREWAELKLSSAAVPAISGLMDAQLATLDQIIAAHEAALTAILTIVLTAPEAAAPTGDGDAQFTPHRAWGVAKKAHKRGFPPETVTPAQAWSRRSRQACEQIDSIVVEYERTGGPDSSRLLKAALRLGSPFTDPVCGRLGDSALTAAIFSTKPETEIRKILMSLPGLRAWRAVTPHDDGFVPDDRRFDLLSSELSAQRALLERAPHIRGLVRAEIGRVQENAERLHRLRKGRLLLIRLVP